jgi:hypothetical protein
LNRKNYFRRWDLRIKRSVSLVAHKKSAVCTLGGLLRSNFSLGLSSAFMTSRTHDGALSTRI